jgi:hypothetical protein
MEDNISPEALGGHKTWEMISQPLCRENPPSKSFCDFLKGLETSYIALAAFKMVFVGLGYWKTTTTAKSSVQLRNRQCNGMRTNKNA